MVRSKFQHAPGRSESRLLRKLGDKYVDSSISTVRQASANPFSSEQYQLAMNVLDQYRGTTVSCRYSIPTRLVDPEAQDELVRAVNVAITDAVLKHSVLHVAIADAHSKRPSWLQLDTIDLQRHVTWRFNVANANFDAVLQGLVTNEVDGKFPDLDSTPGWRIVVVRSSKSSFLEIIFTWNHPHCDGISGKIFQATLLQCLNTVSPDNGSNESSTHSTLLVKLPDTPPLLPPPIEDICKLPLTIPFVLKAAWEEWGPSMLATKPSAAKWAPIVATPYKTQVRAFTIDEERLEEILRKCRQHKTTLTGLLHALTLASLSSQLSQDSAPAFASGTTVDMRRYVDESPPDYPWLQPNLTMGNFVTIMTHEFESRLVDQIRARLADNAAASGAPGEPGQVATPALSVELMDLLWSAAASVRRDIERRLELGLKNDMVGVLKFVGNWQQEMSSAARKNRKHSWWVTGTGVLDGASSKSGHGANVMPRNFEEGTDTWTIQRAQFALSTETKGAAINISPMTVAGGQLCVTATWQDCLFDVSFGEQVVLDLQSWLNHIAQKSP